MGFALIYFWLNQLVYKAFRHGEQSVSDVLLWLNTANTSIYSTKGQTSHTFTLETRQPATRSYWLAWMFLINQYSHTTKNKTVYISNKYYAQSRIGVYEWKFNTSVTWRERELQVNLCEWSCLVVFGSPSLM